MTSPLFRKALRRRRKRAAGMPKSSIGTFCGAAGFGTHARSVISARSLAPGMVCREPRVRLGSFPVMERSTRIGNRLLAALPPADFDLLAPHLREVSLERDAVLVRSGDPTEQIYFPRSGTIAFIMEMPNGQTVATAVVGNEGAVGMLTSLGPSPSPTTAVVRVTGTAWQISPAQFRAELRHSGAIRRAVQIHSRALLAQFQHVAACNALQGEGRAAACRQPRRGELAAKKPLTGYDAASTVSRACGHVGLSTVRELARTARKPRRPRQTIDD